MIINIRGTNGAGKSHMVRSLLEEFQGEPVAWDMNGRKPKVTVYRLLIHPKVFVIGRYDVACGGADTMPKPVGEPGRNSMDVVEAYLREWAVQGHVIFEGLIVSSVWNQRWVRLSQEFGAVWFFLDTSMEECRQRVAERDGGKPLRYEDQGLEKTNLGLVYHRHHRNYAKAVADGVDARLVNYQQARQQIVEI